MKEDNDKAELDEKDLDTDEYRRFRSEGATLIYFGQDRSDTETVVKEICQGMWRPTEACNSRIKRLARYLIGAQRLVWKYCGKEDDDEKMKVDVRLDSDWASGWSRNFTSGGMLTVNCLGVKHWSRLQKARALSSEEAEYHALDRQRCREGRRQPQCLGQAPPREAEVVLGPGHCEGGPGEAE